MSRPASSLLIRGSSGRDGFAPSPARSAGGARPGEDQVARRIVLVTLAENVSRTRGGRRLTLGKVSGILPHNWRAACCRLKGRLVRPLLFWGRGCAAGTCRCRAPPALCSSAALPDETVCSFSGAVSPPPATRSSWRVSSRTGVPPECVGRREHDVNDAAAVRLQPTGIASSPAG